MRGPGRARWIPEVEIKLDKRYPLDVDAGQAWLVLADIRAVAACMPGAQITEQIDEQRFKGSVRTRIGPAAMQFGGDVEVQALDAAAHRLQLHAKGSDRSGSSASMHLSAHLEAGPAPDQSVLVGAATVTVSGKLAQFGNRLLVPVSDALLAQFADNFRAAAGARADAAFDTAAAEESTVVRMVHRSQQPAPSGTEAAASAPAPLGAAVAPASPAAAATPAPTWAAAPPPADAPMPAPPPVRELDALALLWSVFRNWLRRLFGRRA